MTQNEAQAVRKGMECIAKNLTAIEAEMFISALLQGAFNYTDLRRKYFEGAYRDCENDQLHGFLSSAAEHDPKKLSYCID